jgi:hypothetical protein
MDAVSTATAVSEAVSGSIKERASLLQGTVEIYSSPEGGAGVQVYLPLGNSGR